MDKINLANLPTRIEKLKFTHNDIKVYIKRDDQTGFELSGNKVRKLEYALKEALDKGHDTIITCGGIQSNHARATAIACVKLGLEVHLLLKKNEDPSQGNFFLNQMVGAKIHLIEEEAYKNRHEIMNDLKASLDAKGHNTYLIPEGASNGIGNFGYMACYDEILKQSNDMNITFDYIVSAFGSGSTYAGLLMGIKAAASKAINIGYNIYNPSVDAFKMVSNLVGDSKVYGDSTRVIGSDVNIITDYVGLGYAKSRQEEIDFIKEFAKTEGIVLDSVYTGKAMYGLICDIKSGKYNSGTNILFIHTGGLFGNFSKTDLFIK